MYSTVSVSRNTYPSLGKKQLFLYPQIYQMKQLNKIYKFITNHLDKQLKGQVYP